MTLSLGKFLLSSSISLLLFVLYSCARADIRYIYTEEPLTGNMPISEIHFKQAGNKQEIIIEFFQNLDQDTFDLKFFKLRSYYYDLETDEFIPQIQEFSFNSKFIARGAFYVLYFNENDTPINEESIYVPPQNNRVPAISDETGYVELVYYNDDQTIAIQDLLLFGNAKAPPASSHAWQGESIPIQNLEESKSYVRKIDKDGMHPFLDENTVSDWYVHEKSLAYPSDATCVNDGNLIDADEDGIYDCLESDAGYTFWGMDLHAMGARTDQRDVFIEIDYIPCRVSGDHYSQPQKPALEKITAMYQANNVYLHFDAGNLFNPSAGISTEDYNLGGGNNFVAFGESPLAYTNVKFQDDNTDMFYALKKKNFSPKRSQLFYYMLFGYNNIDGLLGTAEIKGTDSLISMAGLGLNANCSPTPPNYLVNLQAAVVAHEFGHNLDLNHGGSTRDETNFKPNFKPNYISIMNYGYANSGLPNIPSANAFYDYSHIYYLNSFSAGSTESNSYIPYGTQCFADPSDPSLFSAFVYRILDQDPSSYQINFSSGENKVIDERLLAESDETRTWATEIDFNCDGIIYKECSLAPNSAASGLSLAQISCSGFTYAFSGFSLMYTTNIPYSESCQLSETASNEYTCNLQSTHVYPARTARTASCKIEASSSEYICSINSIETRGLAYALYSPQASKTFTADALPLTLSARIENLDINFDGEISSQPFSDYDDWGNLGYIFAATAPLSSFVFLPQEESKKNKYLPGHASPQNSPAKQRFFDDSQQVIAR